MSRFIQIHLLTSYPPANLNRDDLGRPKTAKMGGVDRLRTSSQANKRAWRTSEIFESNIKNGIRTKMIGVDAFNKLSAFPALSRSIREDIAKNIAQVFGKLKNNSLELETLVFISDTELSNIDDIINSFSNGLSGATEESNSLGVKLFTNLSSDIQSTLNSLISILKQKNTSAMLINDWSKELKKHIKNFKTTEDKSPYDFMSKMINDNSWVESITGDMEVRDDQLELFFTDEYTKLTKEILKKLSLGDLLSGKNAKDTNYGELKHKECIQLCKGWEEQVDAWVAEIKKSEDVDFTSEDHIQNLKLAVSPVAIAKSSILTNEHTNADIALFGRMLASAGKYNIEAACQVAHAISVHSVVIEDDYFTAVEEMNKYRDDAGAAHIGETGFAAGLFYSYICINRELLLRNLINNFSENIDLNDEKYCSEHELANKAIHAFTEAAVKVPPEGKQNSFGSRAYASYVLAEKGDQQPRSLSVAFLKPITGCDYGTDAINALTTHLNNMDKVYGTCADDRFFVNALNGTGGTYLVLQDNKETSVSSVMPDDSLKQDYKSKKPLFDQLLDFVST